jgi:hypothetical protein
VAPSGVIYVTDESNRRVRVISTTGTITTVASGSSLCSGDGGPAAQVRDEQSDGGVLRYLGEPVRADQLSRPTAA